ncbi:hypothetical protein DVH24_025411 [Malus domestica]|uniref:Uncharacterized protein n=1 Tax=Malus domestica TaxID=3750 RepID=A0A498HMF7_MALDO|nr:hypothetical protein DVH24_025411 [Malus domestica]
MNSESNSVLPFLPLLGSFRVRLVRRRDGTGRDGTKVRGTNPFQGGRWNAKTPKICPVEQPVPPIFGAPNAGRNASSRSVPSRPTYQTHPYFISADLHVSFIDFRKETEKARSFHLLPVCSICFRYVLLPPLNTLALHFLSATLKLSNHKPTITKPSSTLLSLSFHFYLRDSLNRKCRTAPISTILATAGLEVGLKRLLFTLEVGPLDTFEFLKVCLHDWWLITAEIDVGGKRLAFSGVTSRE